jgi:hypothetical protein
MSYDYFGELDAATIKSQEKADRTAFGASKFLSWKDGPASRHIRFYSRRGDVPFLPSKTHWFDDMGDGKGGSLVCRTLVGEHCPVCDFVSKLMMTGNSEDVKLAERIKAGSEYLANVEDVTCDPGTVKIMRVKLTLYKLLIGTDEKSRLASLHHRLGDFTHPQNGYLIEVSKYEAAPWYTAQAAISRETGGIMRSPAKIELGPKLHDLRAEVVVPELSASATMVNYLDGKGPGLRLKDGMGGGGRQAPRVSANRPNLGGQQLGLGAAPQQSAPRGPRAQDSVSVQIDDSFFSEE